MKLGDRDTALATLKLAYESIDHPDKKKNDFLVLGSLIQVAKYQRKLGDLAAAQSSLGRMVKLVEQLESRPFVEEVIQVTGTKEPVRKKIEVNASIRCELLLMIAEEQLAVGNSDLALASCRRALEVVQAQQGIMKPIVLAYVAISLHKSGDEPGARRAIEQARRLANELPDQPEKEGAMAQITRAMAETGDFDGALQLAGRLNKHGSQSAIGRIVDSFTENEPGEGWLPVGGIKITIGAPSLRIKDREAALAALPKLALAARTIADPPIQAQTLSMLAHLQAKAGDFAGAINRLNPFQRSSARIFLARAMAFMMPSSRVRWP